jgi:hypothetical protein
VTYPDGYSSFTGYGGGGGGGGSSYVSPGQPNGLNKATFTGESLDSDGIPFVEIDFNTLAFNPVLPASAECGTAYQYAYAVVNDSSTATTLTETGALPPGLLFDPNGQTITGTPTQTGTFTFTVSASAGGDATPVSRTDTIAVTDPNNTCSEQQTTTQTTQTTPTPEPQPEPPPAGSVPGSFGTGPDAGYFFPTDSGGLGTDFGTIGAASSGGAAGAGSSGASAPTVPTRSGRGGAIYMVLPFACQGPAPCSATIIARVIVLHKGNRIVGIMAVKSKVRRLSVIVGKQNFTVPGGTKQNVSVALNANGRYLMKHLHRMPVRLTINEGHRTIGAAVVKVKRP